MKNFPAIFITTVVSVLAVNYFVFAFTEPTSEPPNDNVPAPINVGSGRQIKNGDLTVENLTATSITLGEDTRFEWPDGVGGSGGGGACAWQGMKCSCKTVAMESGGIFGIGSSSETLRIVVGATCSQGVLTNMGVVDFESSSCPNAAMLNGQKKINSWGCDVSLYTR